MQTSIHTTINSVRRLAHQRSVWLAVGIGFAALLSLFALLPSGNPPIPLADSAINPTALNVESKSNQRLLSVNEQFYPSNVSASPVRASNTQRLLALNEALYPSSVREQKPQRLWALNEMLYPSNSGAPAMHVQNSSRLFELNERLYPSALTAPEAPMFWMGRPH